jgi:hypothetical protein
MSPKSLPNLHETFLTQKALFEGQPKSLQHFLEGQARILAEALIQGRSQLQFQLPRQVVVDASGNVSSVPVQFQQQMIGGLFAGVIGTDSRKALRHRLTELESTEEQSVVAAAQLLRYATALHMIYDMLPSGRSVKYAAVEGEEIPSLPAVDETMMKSAITETSDAITEEAQPENRGELQVPYVPAARRFYLPQWVALDDEGHLLSMTRGICCWDRHRKQKRQ